MFSRLQSLFEIFVDISTQIVYYSFCRQTTMREWLSGGAPPCQGGGRGFDPRLALLFLRNFRNGDRARSRVRSSLRSGRRKADVHWTSCAPSRASFLRRRQAKVPDSCLHEMKALWRPPDIEHEMRDGGGDAGWVVWRLAAYYPLFLGTGIGVFTPLRSALSACHRHAAPLAGSVFAPLRSAPNVPCG